MRSPRSVSNGVGNGAQPEARAGRAALPGEARCEERVHLVPVDVADVAGKQEHQDAVEPELPGSDMDHRTFSSRRVR